MPDPFAPLMPSTHRERPPLCGARGGESRCDLYRDHISDLHRDSHRHTSWPVRQEQTMTEQAMRWHGVIAMEGVESSDGRFLVPNALEWDTPVQLVEVDRGLPWAATLPIGTVDSIERDGRYIRASGTLARTPERPGLEVGLIDWVGDMDDGTLVVEKARVVYVAVGERPVWGDCQIVVEA